MSAAITRPRSAIAERPTFTNCDVQLRDPRRPLDVKSLRPECANSGHSPRHRSPLQRGPWRNFEAIEFATLNWVDWFNNRRLMERIGNIPLPEAEERHFAMLNEPAMVA